MSPMKNWLGSFRLLAIFSIWCNGTNAVPTVIESHMAGSSRQQNSVSDINPEVNQATVPSNQENACVLFTKGELEDMLAMMLMAKSPTFLGLCVNDFHIGLEQPNLRKKNLARGIFRSLGTNVKIYDGESFKADDALRPFQEIHSVASDTIAGETMFRNKLFHILVLGSSRDLGRVINNMTIHGSRGFDNIARIFFNGDWYSDSHDSSVSNKDFDSMKLIFGHGQLQKKIQISSQTLTPPGNVFSKTTFPELFATLQSANGVRTVRALIRYQREKIRSRTGDNGLVFRASPIVATMAMFCESLRAESTLETFILSRSHYRQYEPWEMDFQVSPETVYHLGQPANPPPERDNDRHQYTLKFVTGFKDASPNTVLTSFENKVTELIAKYSLPQRRSQRIQNLQISKKKRITPSSGQLQSLDISDFV